MTEGLRVARNTVKVAELHPVMRGRVASLIAHLELAGYRPRIQEAYRSIEQQQQNVKDGHAQVIWSFHNATALDGSPEALAVDLLDDDYPLRPRMRYLMRLAIACQQLKLETGILWGLAAGPRERLSDAIAARREDWISQVGWDPCHVQPSDVTLLQAKHGLRPAA